MCRVLSVSESGFYGWQRSGKISSSARVPDQKLLVHIRAIHSEVKEEYGWPRVYHALRRRGLRVGKERVRLLMQAHGIRGKAKRRYVTTTDSRHILPLAPNLVQRQFTATAPDRLWCSDITYLPTDEGWLYLAAVVDLFSRQVVGWSLKPHMQTSLVKDALTMACLRRRPAAGLIFHSDRGSQGRAVDGAGGRKRPDIARPMRAGTLSYESLLFIYIEYIYLIMFGKFEFPESS